MKIIALIIDLSLVGISLWMVTIVRGFGGIVGRTMTTITIGAIVLGLAHISETALDYFVPTLNADLGEVIHRVIVFTGMFLIAWGFRQIRELK
jgi:hypothetical protein